jgi:hypothetical protein
MYQDGDGCIPIISALKTQSQEDSKFEATLGCNNEILFQKQKNPGWFISCLIQLTNFNFSSKRKEEAIKNKRQGT